MEKAAIVVIVDDEAVLLRTMSRVFQSEHYDIVTSFTAEGALKAIRDLGERVKVLVTDAQLPDKSGVELAREAEAINPRIRTLFITGGDPPLGEEHRTFLKPFNTLALRQRILFEMKLG
jgi:DNA-binding NtrC family response regulator